MRDLGEPGLAATRYHSPDSVTWAAGVHVATVEVDGDTGAVTLLSYCAVHDAGHEINPLVVAGQTQGGVVQGIGMALSEEVVYESGQAVTGTLMDYALARADSVPAIDVVSADSPSPLNPLGVKGTGEGSAVPGPAAIANAVADALGGDADLTQVPLRPEVILHALQALSRRFRERPRRTCRHIDALTICFDACERPSDWTTICSARRGRSPLRRAGRSPR